MAHYQQVCYNLDTLISVSVNSSKEGTIDNATGYILMFDEIAIERRPRWDDAMNQFLGVCREHGQSLGLEFCSLEEVKALCEAVGHNEVHLASEVRTQRSVSSISFPTCHCRPPLLLSALCWIPQESMVHDRL
jgi:hypothetical protein